MELTDLIKTIPAGSPAAEILKIALLIAGTVFVDMISDVVKESLNAKEYTKIIDVLDKEAE